MRRHLPPLLAICVLAACAACAGRGREVFVREGCVNCHRFGDLGAQGGIDLTGVGARRDAAWIATQIGTPTAHDPASRMPPFPRISGMDLRSLVAFLRR